MTSVQTKIPFINTDDTFTEGVTIPLFGYDLDQTYFIITLGGIVSQIFLWGYMGVLWRIPLVPFQQVLFVSAMVYYIVSLFTSSKMSGSVNLELTKRIHIEQANSVFLGSLIVLLFVLNNIPSKNMGKINVDLVLIIGILMINQLTIYTEPTGRNIKMVTEIKHMLMAICIFTVAGVLCKYSRENVLNSREL